MAGILEKIKEHVESLPENKSPPAELRISSAGECPTKLDRDFQFGVRPINFQTFIRFELGHATHRVFQKIVADALGDDFFGAEEEVWFNLASGTKIPGHPDGRIKSLKATLELKSVSDATFQMIRNQNAPLEQHIDQGNCYAWVVKDPFVLIVYINRDTGEMIEYLFETDAELGMAVQSKFEIREVNRREGIIEPRPYKNAMESPCWYCPHKEPCYEGFAKQIESLNSTILTSQPLIDECRKYIKTRSVRLVSEKMEDKIKTFIGNEITQMGFKFAKMEDAEGAMTVEVKVGKNNNLLTSIKEAKRKA